jgi:hypothetical protein
MVSGSKALGISLDASNAEETSPKMLTYFWTHMITG